MRKLVRSLLTLVIVTVPALAGAETPEPDDGVDSVAAIAKRPARSKVTSRSWADLTDSGLAPAWSYGLSFPVTRFGFQQKEDGTYSGTVTPLQAGVGTSIFWNAVRSKDGSVPVGIGALLFGATDLGSARSDAGLGIAIGPSFWNNTFALMAGVDLYRRIGDVDTGALMINAGGKNGFERQNVFVLLNFGIGLGKSAPGSLKIAP